LPRKHVTLSLSGDGRKRFAQGVEDAIGADNVKETMALEVRS
jgi:hypothetical protein